MKEEIFKINTAGSEKTIAQLRKELKEAKSALYEATQGTEEYNAALQKAADITDQLGDLQQLVNRTSTGIAGKMASVSGALQGVSGAANAVIGTMSLLGVENDELQKKLNDSVTALIGITQGLGSIDPAVKSFREMKVWLGQATQGMNKFKIALVSTGLGALVVVLGSIIANWEEFSQLIGVSSDTMEKFGIIVQKTIRAASTIIKNFTQAITQSVGGIINAFKKVFKGDFSGAFDELKKGFKNAGKEFKEIINETTAEWKTDLPPKAQKNSKDAGKKIAEKVAEGFEEKLERELTEWANKYSFDKIADIILKNIDEKLKEQKEIDKILIPVEPDFSSMDAEDQIRSLAKDLFTDQTTGITDWLGLEDFINQYPIVTDALNEISKRKLEIAKTTQTENDRQKKLTENISCSAQMIGYFGDMMGSLSDIFAENEEAAKAFSIVQTISQTAVGIITALSGTFTTKTGPWDIALAVAQAASIAAAGVAQIFNIKNQKIGNAQANIPTVPDVKTSAVQQSNYTGGEYKVYVTETDITSVQNRVRVIENGARY